MPGHSPAVRLRLNTFVLSAQPILHGGVYVAIGRIGDALNRNGHEEQGLYRCGRCFGVINSSIVKR